MYERLFAWMMAQGDSVQDRLYGTRKRRLLSDLDGDVLEIGPGTGVNLPYYPDGTRWTGLEPNPHMHDYAREKAKAQGCSVELHTGSAEDIDLLDASVDAVVSTLVLCSVDDLPRALAEIRRVLRPGGRFVFLEHVAGPEGSARRRAQRLARPVWRPVADGCRPDRDTGAAIKRVGFDDVDYERFPVGSALNLLRPHIAGTARKG